MRDWKRYLLFFGTDYSGVVNTDTYNTNYWIMQRSGSKDFFLFILYWFIQNTAVDISGNVSFVLTLSLIHI